MTEPRHVTRTIPAEAMEVPQAGDRRGWDDLESWLHNRGIRHYIERDVDGHRHLVYLAGGATEPAEVIALPGDWIVDDDCDELPRVWRADDFEAMFTDAPAPN